MWILFKSLFTLWFGIDPSLATYMRWENFSHSYFYNDLKRENIYIMTRTSHRSFENDSYHTSYLGGITCMIWVIWYDHVTWAMYHWSNGPYHKGYLGGITWYDMGYHKFEVNIFRSHDSGRMSHQTMKNEYFEKGITSQILFWREND